MSYNRLLHDINDFKNTKYKIKSINKIKSKNGVIFESIIVSTHSNEYTFIELFEYPYKKPLCIAKKLSTNKKTIYLPNNFWSPVQTLLNYVETLENNDIDTNVDHYVDNLLIFKFNKSYYLINYHTIYLLMYLFLVTIIFNLLYVQF